jgi:phosphate transport system substrate-binding protein
MVAELGEVREHLAPGVQFGPPVLSSRCLVSRWSFLLLAVAAWGCKSESSKADSSNAPGAVANAATGADLTGAGATFPAILYSKWIADYAAKTGVKINYQPIGSGGGIKQLQEQTVDFGASDAPMNDTELASAKGGPVMHIPMVAGVVAIAYNLPQLKQPLKLTGALVADIFGGRITKWNDSRIAAVNPGVTLPATDILVVHRSEGSGTTYIFSDYLSGVSSAWKDHPGKGKELQWPVGLGAKGNEGVSAQVKQTPGSVGYVELAYAKQNNLSTALLQNAAGKFVPPSAEAATAAVQSAADKLPAATDYRISIVNSPGADSYPITSLTWLLVYQRPTDATKAKKLADFIRWALTNGGSDATALDYAPLPQSLVTKLTTRLDSVSPGSAP